MDGKGPQPFEHRIGRLSEELGGMAPSLVIAEVAALPVGFLERMLLFRNYAHVKAQYDASTGTADDSLLQLVKDIERDIQLEEMEAARE